MNESFWRNFCKMMVSRKNTYIWILCYVIIWKYNQAEKNFVKLYRYSLVTSLLITLIWQKKVDLTVKIIITFYNTFPHVGEQISHSVGGNLANVLPLWFYVKSIFKSFSSSKNCHFDHLAALNYNFLVNLNIFICRIPKSQNTKAGKW